MRGSVPRGEKGRPLGHPQFKFEKSTAESNSSYPVAHKSIRQRSQQAYKKKKKKHPRVYEVTAWTSLQR